MEPKSKNCPFCGGNTINLCMKRQTNKQSSGDIIITTHYYMECQNCGATSRIVSDEHVALTEWNRRVIGGLTYNGT